jgi:hypothetical protein
MAHLEIGRRYACLKDAVALVFDGTAKIKAALFIDRSEEPAEVTAFGTHIKMGRNTRGLNISDRNRLLSVGYPTVEELLSQSEFILELLNDTVTLTGGVLEFSAVHNLHCTAHVFYDAFFFAAPQLPGSPWIGRYPSWSQ